LCQLGLPFFSPADRTPVVEVPPDAVVVRCFGDGPEEGVLVRHRGLSPCPGPRHLRDLRVWREFLDGDQLRQRLCCPAHSFCGGGVPCRGPPGREGQAYGVGEGPPEGGPGLGGTEEVVRPRLASQPDLFRAFSPPAPPPAVHLPAYLRKRPHTRGPR